MAGTNPRLDLLISLVLVVATLSVYWQVRGFGFIDYDDGAYVKDNPYVTGGLSWATVRWAFTTSHVCNWHPLTWLSLMLDVQLFGVNPGAHHLVNVLVHAANTVLLFWTLRRMTDAVWPSAFVAALFAIHPLHVESVAWIAERKDVLSTLFWLLTLAGYLHYVRRPGRLRYVLVAAPLALGLMAKPMLVSLPAILLLLDYWPLRRLELSLSDPKKSAVNLGRRIIEKLPLFALVGLSSVATFLAQRSGGGVVPFSVIPFSLRVQNAFVAYARYILLMLWPSGLAAFYPHAREALPVWQPLLSILALGGATVAVLAGARRFPYLGVGWLWYLGTLVPVIGVIQVGDQALADRYTYVPLIGLFLMAAWGVRDCVARWRIPKSAAGVGAAAVLLALAACTAVQVGYWRDSITLFEHALKVTPDNYLAHKVLGVALCDEAGRYEEAAAHCRAAIAVNPSDADLHYNLGNALLGLGKADEAIAAYQKTLTLDPRYVKARYNLGNAHARQARYQEAAACYGEVVEAQPGFPGAANNLGSALVFLGKLEEAAAVYRGAIEANPRDLDACCNLGYTLGRLGRSQEAARMYSTALNIDPACKRAQEALKGIEAGGTPK
jgi:tetratricopeptide (TPR) repeat protein